MPRPRSLTPDVIAAAALAALDRDGHGSLSMRTVARELGMSTMALYKYVTGRAELERLITETVLRPVVTTVPERASWTEQVETLVGRVRDAAAAHPEAVPTMLAHRHSSERTLRWIEAMLAVLGTAGFTGSGLVIAQRTIVNYLVGAIQSQHLSSVSGKGTEAMAALSVDEFPCLVRTAREARAVDPEQEFRQGLRIVLDGLSATRPQ